MQLFNNFDNLPENYIPNNMFPPKPPTVELCITQDNVDPIYKCGKLIGYTWDYGEDVSLEISHEITITVREGSLFSTEDEPVPTSSTVGENGQRFYNLQQMRSWKCYIIDDTYDWVEDENLVFLSDGEVSVKSSVPMEGKSTLVQFLNFRKEVIAEQQFDTEGQGFIWRLDREESKKYPAGIYYMNIYIVSGAEETLSDTYEIRIR